MPTVTQNCGALVVAAGLANSALAQIVQHPDWINNAKVTNGAFATRWMQNLPNGMQEVYRAKGWTVYPTRSQSTGFPWVSGIALRDKTEGPPVGAPNRRIGEQITYKGKLQLVAFYSNSDVITLNPNSKPVPIAGLVKAAQCNTGGGGSYSVSNTITASTGVSDSVTTTTGQSLSASLSDALTVNAGINMFGITAGISNALTVGFTNTSSTSTAQMNSRTLTSTYSTSSTILNNTAPGYTLQPTMSNYHMTRLRGIIAFALVDDSVGRREIDPNASEDQLVNEYNQLSWNYFPYVYNTKGENWARKFTPYRVVYAQGTWDIPHSLTSSTTITYADGSTVSFPPPIFAYFPELMPRDDYIATCRGDFGRKNAPSTHNIAPAQKSRFCTRIGGTNEKPTCHMGPWEKS